VVIPDNCREQGWLLLPSILRFHPASPVMLLVAPLVRISRAIVGNIVASTQNTGPRMLGQTGVWPGTRTKNINPVSAMPTVARLIQ
jgi:hypothetical protein